MAHFIPTHSTATAINVANLFITHIWKIHGLPKKAISDRGPNFNAKVLKQIYKRLDIKPSFSTAYHPQTDGQTERLNQVVEIYLRHYTSHRQHNWAALLPMAEFAYNNGTQASTGKTPFFICYGFHPRFSISDLEPSNIPAADNHIQFLQKGYEEVQSAITISQERMKTYYDRKHREAKDYAIGDKVWLSGQNIQTDRPSRKLAHKNLGPFEIIEQVGTHAFKLSLPPSMKVHPVFHVTLLRPYERDDYGREPEQPPPIVVESGEKEYEVEQILNSKKTRGKLHYLIKWKGYSEESNSWEPKEHVENSPELIRRFHHMHPHAPGP
ncbi:Retrotransposable element Tf2 [Ceratobasidium theobromae]|uniref:Retrotransposable element Tf2 n=1 Tax=Ceratobasidium theobromae TaxID=1582974 RepID=A0A5N5Q8Y8_9AGAM|nr:Retrotransposable element Tf2 [Ceratobasidium theobromae]